MLVCLFITWFVQRATQSEAGHFNRACALGLTLSCFQETFHHHLQKPGLAHWRTRDHVRQSQAIAAEGPSLNQTSHLTDNHQSLPPHSSCQLTGEMNKTDPEQKEAPENWDHIKHLLFVTKLWGDLVRSKE